MSKLNQWTTNVYKSAIIGGIVLTSLFYFLNGSTTPSSADTPKVNFTMSPSTGTYPIIKTQYSAVILKTSSSSQKISGFDITIRSAGSVSMADITVTTPTGPDGKPLQMQQLARTVSPREIHLNYVIIAAAASLPQSINMRVQFSGWGKGTGTISLDPSISKVVGNIPNNLYIWGKTAGGTYTFY